MLSEKVGFISVPQLKPHSSPNAGWEGSVFIGVPQLKPYSSPNAG